MIAIFLCCISAGAQTAADSLAVVSADWNWNDLGKGMMSGSAQLPMFGGIQSISIVKYPARKHSSSVLHSPAGDAASTDVLAKDNDALAAINGSYFNMRELTPTTYLSVNGQQLGSTDPSELFRIDGLLILNGRAGRKVSIAECDTLKLDKLSKRNRTILAAGPLLITDGRDRTVTDQSGFTTNRHNRSIIGLDGKGNVYLIVVDGRYQGEADGMTIAEVIALCRYLGLEDALNLDGGGSSQIWTREEGTLNYPSDNERWDHDGGRTIPNCILVN